MMSADDVGKSGHETKQELDADRAFLDAYERLRRKAALLMGMGDVTGSVLPKVVMLAPPRNGGTPRLALPRPDFVPRDARADGRGMRSRRVQRAGQHRRCDRELQRAATSTAS